MDKINRCVGEIVFGALFILISVWMFIFLNDVTARMMGGGIVAALGAMSLASGIIHLCKR